MMINNNKVKSDEVTFNVYKRNGCSYIKARQWVTLIDGTLAHIEGNGKKGRCQILVANKYRKTQ